MPDETQTQPAQSPPAVLTPTPPTIDINKYTDILGDVSKYFISNDNHRAPLIVRHEDGIACFVIDESGVAHPWDAGGRELVQSRAVAIGVKNPDGFTGFPEHNKDDPVYKLDNPSYAATLGDASKYHVDFDGPEPRVVEHITGEVKFTFKDGTLIPVPIKPESAPAPEPAPAPAAA